LKFEIILGAQPNFHNASIDTYHQFDEKVNIYLQEQECEHCGLKLVDDEVIAHTLEHEMIETLSNWIRYEDREINVDPNGFDHMAIKFRKKEVTHICGAMLRTCWWG